MKMRSVSARRGSLVRPLANTTAELQALRTVTTLKLQLSFTLSCFHTYLLLLCLTPPYNTFFLILFLSLSPSDGSITGAMLRELLQPSLSGCVSSNVRVELSNLLTMQEKGKKENEEKNLSGPQMMPAGSHRALNFAGCFSPLFCLVAPGLRFTDIAILGLYAWRSPSSCVQQKKNDNNKIKK